jgi:Tfp pilus assembly PilM family ATPase
LGTLFKNNQKPVLFADDTSLIVIHDNQTDFNRDVTSAFYQLNKWFAANLLSLNLNKTQYVQFMTKNTPTRDISISYNNILVLKNLHT